MPPNFPPLPSPHTTTTIESQPIALEKAWHYICLLRRLARQYTNRQGVLCSWNRRCPDLPLNARSCWSSVEICALCPVLHTVRQRLLFGAGRAASTGCRASKRPGLEKKDRLTLTHFYINCRINWQSCITIMYLCNQCD